MSERDAFEAWFESVYGQCPRGNSAKIRDEAAVLMRHAVSIEEWQQKHAVALVAWSERHHRSESK